MSAENDKIDYLAEHQNGGKLKGRLGLAPYRVMGPVKGNAIGCRPVGGDHRAPQNPRARQKNNHGLHGLHGFVPQNHPPIDYLAECQNGGQITRELTPLETAPIDYLAEWGNGPWGEELTTEEDAERRESGN